MGQNTWLNLGDLFLWMSISSNNWFIVLEIGTIELSWKFLFAKISLVKQVLVVLSLKWIQSHIYLSHIFLTEQWHFIIVCVIPISIPFLYFNLYFRCIFNVLNLLNHPVWFDVYMMTTESILIILGHAS